MKKKEIFLHIGFPKTGTTTLQKHFFPFIEEINYLGKFDNESCLFNFNRNIINNLIFNDEVGLKTKYELYANEICSFMEKEKILLSEESFLSNSLRASTIKEEDIIPLPITIAKNLRYLFDLNKYDVKILVTIRKQDEMITSLYAQSFTHYYSKYKEYNTFKKFTHYFLNKNHVFHHCLDYNSIVEIYKSIFGTRNVFVLVFEELENDPEIFYEKLCCFLGVNVNNYRHLAISKIENKRSTNKQYKRTRKQSLFVKLRNIKLKYFPRLKLKLSKELINLLNSVMLSNNKIDKSIFLTNIEKESIINIYSDSNYILSKKMSLNLEKYGYFN